MMAALAIGVGSAITYYVQDLTLSHYDAKAHLVVARRIVDSMRPGWMQIGAVWLPLPHLLNLIPVQAGTIARDAGRFRRAVTTTLSSGARRTPSPKGAIETVPERKRVY